MKYEYNLILRVVLALLIRPEIFTFSLMFLTIYFPYLLLLVLGYKVQLIYSAKTILVNGGSLQFVDACVANSAYYLLTLLILTTKDIGFKKSVKMFLFGSLLIYLMNIFRITLLILIVLNMGLDWFNVIHMTFWYVVSTVYVVLVWIFLIKMYNVKNIPIYSDAKHLIGYIKGKKK